MRHRLLVIAVTLLGGLALVPAAQAAGPPTSITLQLSPTTIVADGVSTATATATVTDLTGAGFPGETVTFTSSPALTISSTTDNGDGTYTATITSSTTPGTAYITATDKSAGLTSSPPQALTQSPGTTLSVLPSPTVSTNQPVTLIAAVAGSPSGAISFYDGLAPIAPCQGVSVSSSHPFAACAISFAASASPADLTAVFVPASGSAGSNQTQRVDVVAGGTTTTIGASVPAAGVGTPVRYTAFVAPSNQGPATPTGSVRFIQGGKPLAHCSSVPLQASGGGFTASCSVKYSTLGTRRVTASYSGDQNFNGSSSGTILLPVQALGVITSTMQWTWGTVKPSYTTIAAMSANGVSLGTKVVITCSGHGCPFARRVVALSGGTRCTPTGKQRCNPKGPLNITGFRHHRLMSGVRITVQIRRQGWVAKFYSFLIRPGRQPQVRISCVAPGFSKPGIGC